MNNPLFRPRHPAANRALAATAMPIPSPRRSTRCLLAAALALGVTVAAPAGADNTEDGKDNAGRLQHTGITADAHAEKQPQSAGTGKDVEAQEAPQTAAGPASPDRDPKNDGTDGKKVEPRQTDIEADSVDMDFGARKAVFEGHVVVTDGHMTLKADKMTVHFSPAKELETIEARGNVVIRQPGDNRHAQAGSVFYDVTKGTFTLTDDPMLENTLRNAEEITYFRDSDRVITKGKRTKIKFTPEGEDGTFDIFQDE